MPLSIEEKLPDSWNATIEKSKEKARKLINQLIAVDQVTSIIIGKLNSVEIDKLWHLKYPYCRLTMSRPIRFRQDGRMQHKMADQELFFINKPTMVMSIKELETRHPKIYDTILPKIRTETWG